MNNSLLLMANLAWLWTGLSHGDAMFWETLWALVLGFGISAALQVFVSKERMTQLLGRNGLEEILLATGFGAACSSCSYAAASIGRSAFQKGAALVPALAFMFASTNLVIELGVVLWLLMGWQFVMAEVLGAFVLITLMWWAVRLFLPRKVEQEIKGGAHLQFSRSHCHSEPAGHPTPAGQWTRVANAFVMDWSMLWKEILGGFLIAGFIATLVPHRWWENLFLQSGPAALRVIENALVGPL